MSLVKCSIKETDPDKYDLLIKDRTKFSIWTLKDEEISQEDKLKTIEEQIVLTEHQLVISSNQAS